MLFALFSLHVLYTYRLPEMFHLVKTARIIFEILQLAQHVTLHAQHRHTSTDGRLVSR